MTEARYNKQSKIIGSWCILAHNNAPPSTKKGSGCGSDVPNAAIPLLVFVCVLLGLWRPEVSAPAGQHEQQRVSEFTAKQFLLSMALTEAVDDA